MPVVQQLPNIVATITHDFEPPPRLCAQRFRLLGYPGFDCGILFDRTIEPEDLLHRVGSRS
jgi:hypothetical protein